MGSTWNRACTETGESQTAPASPGLRGSPPPHTGCSCGHARGQQGPGSPVLKPEALSDSCPQWEGMASMSVLSVVLAAEWGLRPGLGARRPPPAWAVVSPSVKEGVGGRVSKVPSCSPEGAPGGGFLEEGLRKSEAWG